MSTTPLRSIYQLKVTLIGSKPPVWRRILVPSNIALGKLHLVLQISMGWTNSHIHQYISDGVFYGIQDDDFGFDMEVGNEDKYKLSQLLKSEKDSLKYEYDFGDGWEHKVLLEKVLPFDKSNQAPLCIKGERACPPEDCGGILGYQELLETLSNPNDSEYKSMLEWLGDDFDSEDLDIEEINKMLVEYVK
ncbi:MAG: plasmid pRiA4b ORF-3 family protein [Methylococcales symbiont of Iophon sp. n. MRB-2018]|nr:MAG: plasmid pRiA4b ORF-3 family protein [Methylococcales symbiont of Iophon sp. n. MRB-2018]